MKYVEEIRSTFDFFRGNVRIITLSHVILNVTRRIVWAFFPLYVLALGGTASTVGFANTVGRLASLALYPVGGFIADYSGRVKLIGRMTYFWALTWLFFALARDWIALVLGVFFQCLVAFYLPAMSAITADSLPPDSRGIGYATITVLPGIIAMISPYIGGLLINAHGLVQMMRIFYTVCICLGFIVATLRYFFLKETISDKRTSRDAINKNILLLIINAYKNIFATLRQMPRPYRPIAVILILQCLSISLLSPFWIIYATEIIGVTTNEWGILLLLINGMNLAFLLPFGRLVDKYGKRRIIVPTIFLELFLALLFVFSKTFLQMLFLFASITVVDVFMTLAFKALSADILPRFERGRMMSAFGAGAVTINISGGAPYGVGGFVLFLPAIVGASFGGLIYDLNPTYPWIIFSILMFLCFILSIRFIREPEKPEE